MTNNEFQRFYVRLLKVLTTTDFNAIKRGSGSSTRNNRIPSVNQVARFLEGSGVYGHKTLAKNLRHVYNQVRPDMRYDRLFNLRTDAYDIYEFLNVFDR
jgi:hypothetical protein